MKKLLYAFLLLPFFSCSNSPDAEKKTTDSAVVQTSTDSAGIDTALIRKLHADDYGMHPYVIAFLKEGPNRNQDSATAAQLQQAHMNNIVRMAKEGKLAIAGPFMDDSEIAGIYIFNVSTVEEAEALTATDPAIKAGRLVMELHPWYGSAALQEVNAIHNKIQRKKF